MSARPSESRVVPCAISQHEAGNMLETKWVIFAGWSLFGFFLVGIGIGLSWGQTAIMAMVASFALVSAIRIDRQWRAMTLAISTSRWFADLKKEREEDHDDALADTVQEIRGDRG